MNKTLILLLPLMLAGCSSYGTFYQNFVNRINTDTLNYQCDEQPLEIALNNKLQQATLTWDNQPLTLKQGLSASGTRYTDGVYVFWSKGDEATLYRHDTVILHNCNLATASH